MIARKMHTASIYAARTHVHAVKVCFNVVYRFVFVEIFIDPKKIVVFNRIVITIFPHNTYVLEFFVKQTACFSDFD